VVQAAARMERVLDVAAQNGFDGPKRAARDSRPRAALSLFSFAGDPFFCPRTTKSVRRRPQPVIFRCCQPTIFD